LPRELKEDGKMRASPWNMVVVTLHAAAWNTKKMTHTNSVFSESYLIELRHMLTVTWSKRFSANRNPESSEQMDHKLERR
jgi:hypothetical protein